MDKLIKPNVPFGMVPNSLLNNKDISLKSKGLFAFMQSKPDGWNFSVEKICFQSKESRTSVSEGLKELELHGYLTREQSREKGILGGIDYSLFFDPSAVIPLSDFPLTVKPLTVKPLTEKPFNGKSVNISKKDISNKDYSKKEEREGALSFFENNFPERNDALMMQFKKQINDYVKFSQLFDATVEQEKLEFDGSVISGRFKKFAINWIANQNKFDNKVIELNPNQRIEKIGCF